MIPTPEQNQNKDGVTNKVDTNQLEQQIRAQTGHHVITQFKFCAECGEDMFNNSFGCWNCGGHIEGLSL